MILTFIHITKAAPAPAKAAPAPAKAAPMIKKYADESLKIATKQIGENLSVLIFKIKEK